MIYDQISHEWIVVCNGLYVIPIAERFIDFGIVEHRKTIIRGKRIKGEYVERTNTVRKIFVDKGLQRFKWLYVPLEHWITVGDHDYFFLVPEVSDLIDDVLFWIEPH